VLLPRASATEVLTVQAPYLRQVELEDPASLTRGATAVRVCRETPRLTAQTREAGLAAAKRATKSKIHEVLRILRGETRPFARELRLRIVGKRRTMPHRVTVDG
jgi:hypothetical protein